jgi:hypothetical protein
MKKRAPLDLLRNYDWDAIAGLVAAVAALVLHLLHVIEQDVVLSIILVVLAILLLRDLRDEGRDERMEELLERTHAGVEGMGAALTPPDAVLVGPRQLRKASEDFARRARGEMVWFNVCLLMFRPQSLFDSLLRPAIENPRVTAIQFVLDSAEQERWREDVMPKVRACPGAGKVLEPRWCSLNESVSFILADSEDSGRTEAQLSFWGEPFMARTPGHDVPRYIFHVQPHSELIPQLVELERAYRLRT